ncbi:MAG: hypothetical protein ACXVDD_00200 [Polyangia bacterium]
MLQWVGVALLALIAATTTASAQNQSSTPSSPPPAQHELPDPEWLGTTTPDQISEASDQQLRFIAFFFSRIELSNIAATNDLLSGRVGGRLFGSNTTTTSDGHSLFAEQRFVPFIQFEPKLLNHWARLRLSFQIDFTWGDSAYGTGGNFGGALGTRQINLETQNVHVEFNLPLRGWYLTVGMQRLTDNPRDSYRTPFSTLAYTSSRLTLWASDAVGATLYGRIPSQIFKLGAYDLYENSISKDDNVWLFQLMTDRDLGRGLHLGGQVQYLRDTSSGGGGIAVVGQGPSSMLPEYIGGYRFPIGNAPFNAHIVWVGLDTSYNPEFAIGRLGFSAFVVGNFGAVISGQAPLPSAAGVKGSALTNTTQVTGVIANARVGYRYGRTRNDHVDAEVMYTSGDPNGIADGHYSGVMTGNTWGAPAALYVSSGAYLLLPHPNVVNRIATAAFDISNMGLGLTSATLNAGWDFIPNVLGGKLGLASGFSNLAPTGGGHFIGFEVNGNLVYRLRAGFNVELHGAYMHLGDFFDSPTVVTSGMGRPRDPWMTMLALKWLII